MNQQPQISFILPTYNVEPYLARCLKSIITQQISKEIIIVNDGSTDNSLLIAEQYAKQYDFIRVITTENKGVSAARNLGMDLAKGEYLMFVDPDDILEENIHFSTILSLMQEHNTMIAKGLCHITMLNGKKYRFDPVNTEVLQGYAISTKSSITFANHSLPDNWLMLITGFIFNSDWLKTANIKFNEEINFSEDIIFTLDFLASNTSIIEVPFILYHYFKRENSLSTSTDNLYRAKQLEKILSLLNIYLEKYKTMEAYIRKVIEIHYQG